jgi:putative MATE family efflux protein
MACVSVINIILDPLFIFGIWIFPEMGIKGAAVATIISRIISTTIAFSYMHFKMRMFDPKVPKFKDVMDSWKRILTLGIPTSFSLMLTPISMAIITRIIATYGDQAVAAAGAGGRIDMLALMVIFALSSVLLPFTGQNFGAGKIARIKKALNKANGFSFLWGMVMLTLFFFFKSFIAGLFSKDPVVVDYINTYLLFIAVAYPAIGVAIMSANVLNGLHKPMMTAGLNFFRTIVMAVPITYLGGMLEGPKGVFAGIAFTNLFASLFYHYLAKRQLKLEAK